jgi:serine protease Do
VAEQHIIPMAFPIDPDHGESLSQFLVQDPFQLRKQILPVLTMDKDGGFLTGLGTAFRADPFGTFVTAEHVLKDHFESPAKREAAVATVLYGMGLVYGTGGLSSKYFAPIQEALMWRAANPEPTPIIGAKEPPRIVADVMRFHVDDSKVPGQQTAPPLPIRLSGGRPKVGDRVMAIGYPELTCLQHDDIEKAMTFTERMYAAVGTITALLPQGRGAFYPWPLIEVQAHWRSGMSGGPVFNEAGEVIGLVSFSIEPDGDLPGVGYATDLAGVHLSRLVPTIDASNPGWCRGWGVVRSSPWHLSGVFPDQAQADEHRKKLGPDYEVRAGSHRIGSDDFVS